MSEIDNVISGLDRISLLAQLKDKVNYAIEAGELRCGACNHWMKSRVCPREKNIGGMTRGPSSGSLACDQFSRSMSSIATQGRRVCEAIEFAEAHHLPIPTHLQSKAQS